jgi:hypothetical protein
MLRSLGVNTHVCENFVKVRILHLSNAVKIYENCNKRFSLNSRAHSYSDSITATEVLLVCSAAGTRAQQKSIATLPR